MLRVKRGNFGYVIPVTILDKDFRPLDLAGFTITMKVRTAATPPVLRWTLAGTIISAVAGRVDFGPASIHFTEAGSFIGEIELTRTGYQDSTDPFPIEVLESL